MISVVIPMHNSRQWIKTAIDSILNQHGLLCEPEIIVIDDASTDDSVDYVKHLYNDRIKIIRMNKNLGVSAARNIGLKTASGDFICMLDSDDWFSVDRLANLERIIISAAVDIVSDGYLGVSDSGTYRYPPRFWFDAPSASLSQTEFVHYDLGPLKPMFRREFIVEHNIWYDEDLRYAEDFDLIMKMFYQGARYQLENSYGYSRLMHQGSLSKNLSLGIKTGINKGYEYFRLARERHNDSLCAELLQRISYLKSLRRKQRRAKFGIAAMPVNKIESLIDSVLLRTR